MSVRVLAPLALGLAALASGFVRTTDRESKACLAWRDREVRWVVNPARPATSPSCDGDGALAAVRAAFAAWPNATAAGAGAPCTDLRLVDGGVTSAAASGYSRDGDNENLVVFRQGWCSDRVPVDDGCWDDGTCADEWGCFADGAEGDRHVIAVTTVTYESDSGTILDADIEVADWDGRGGRLSTPPTNGWYFTCNDDVPQCASYGEDGCAFIDLRNTLTHEVGHLVGLAHVARTSANRSITMYPDTGPLDVSKRDLSADDVAGVCTIYPTGAETPSCGGERDEGCGGQTAGEPRSGGAAGVG
ncbi:MAG TPA: matrixin family metalloprotease, partial [Anaeromyxobacteraceae bacterium]|nr:matrixin family metalloprotease [Anaeromyxobacteraceae bacterium]